MLSGICQDCPLIRLFEQYRPTDTRITRRRAGCSEARFCSVCGPIDNPAVPNPRVVQNPDRASGRGVGRKTVADGPGRKLLLPLRDCAAGVRGDGDRPLPVPAPPPKCMELFFEDRLLARLDGLL